MSIDVSGSNAIFREKGSEHGPVKFTKITIYATEKLDYKDGYDLTLAIPFMLPHRI